MISNLKTLLQRCREAVTGADTRSLTLLRMGLGILFISMWSPQMGDHGIIEGVVWFAGLLIAFSLMLGQQSRFSTIAAYFGTLFAYSVNVTSLGHEISNVRMLLWWSMFIPLAATFSVDAAMDDKSTGAPRGVYSISIAAIKVMSLFCILHPTVVISPMTKTVMGVIFIPTVLWNALFGILQKRERSKVTVYYDGDCGFCKKSVRLLKTFLLLPHVKLLVAQDDPSVFRDMEEHHSWIVEDETKRFYKFDAMERLWRASPFLFWLAPLLSWPPISKLGTRSYEATASRRNYGSILLRGLVLGPKSFRFPEVSSAVATLAFVYALVIHAISYLNVRMVWPVTSTINIVLGLDYLS